MGPTKPNRFVVQSPQHYSYQAYGLILRSSLACPELLPQGGTPDVTISLGTVPETLKTAQKREAAYEVSAEAFLLKIPAIARYLVLKGKEIIIDPVPGVPEHEVRVFLLGSVFGALFYQRGLLPLHGCALEINDAAVIFLGASGSGKSSLAGALNQRGYRVITDDVSVLAFSPAGSLVVQPACRHLKLGAEVLRTMGRDPKSYTQVLPDLEKYCVPLKEEFCGHPRPVARIYELATHDSRDFRIIPLQGTDKLTALITHTYRLDFLEGLPQKKRYFEQCGQAARQLPISRLYRPRWPFPLTELAAALEKEWG